MSFLLLSLAACSSSSSSSASATRQACLDTADAVAKAAVRCGAGGYQANYNAFVKAAANGDCGNVTAVRDEASLRATCIPSFSTISCADLAAGNLDPTCKAQLGHQSMPALRLSPEEARWGGMGDLTSE
jgi:hypothetical protein